MSSVLRAGLAAGLLVLAVELSGAEPRYTVVDFGRHTQGVDLNARGEVVYYDADTLETFRYTNGKSIALPQPPEGRFLPIAMNDRGEIIGHALRRQQVEARRKVAQSFIFSRGHRRRVPVDQ